MTSKELEQYKNAFESQVSGVISSYKNVIQQVNSANSILCHSNDTILKNISSNDNQKIISKCSEFISRAESLRGNIVAKTNKKIDELKRWEEEERNNNNNNDSKNSKNTNEKYEKN